MVVTFNRAKNAANVKNHGYSLVDAERLDMDTALFIQDDSQDYGEERWIVIGFLDAQLCVLVCTFTGDDTFHAISLRDAEPSERKTYAEEI